MLAALATLWLLFSFWLVAPLLRAPARLARAAVALLGAELVLLLVWSYGTDGCADRACAPVAQTAGVAARVDLPIVAALFLTGALAVIARREPRRVAGR